MEKNSKEMISETEKFIKSAFCVDGDVKFVNKKKTYVNYFEAVDKTRGKFTVSFASSND